MPERMKTTKIKYMAIYDAICGAIVDGKYLPGEKIPTEKEIAAQFNASRPTVGRAMRDLEQHGMLVRRQGAGTFVRSTTNSGTKTFGILIPWQGDDSLNSNTSVFAAMVPEISRILSRNGHTLSLNESARDNLDKIATRVKAMCRQLIEHQVAGVFFMPIEDPVSEVKLNAEIAEAFEQAGIAVVLLDRDINEWSNRSKYDVVAIDNEYASAVESVIELQRAGADGPQQLQTLADERTAAFVELAQHYLPDLNHQTLSGAWFEVRGQIGEIFLLKEDRCRNLRSRL